MKKIKRVKKLKTDLYFVLTGDLIFEERNRKTNKLIHAEKLDDSTKQFFLNLLVKELTDGIENWLANPHLADELTKSFGDAVVKTKKSSKK